MYSDADSQDLNASFEKGKGEDTEGAQSLEDDDSNRFTRDRSDQARSSDMVQKRGKANPKKD